MKLLFFLLFSLSIFSCNSNLTVKIDDNTFTYKGKVFRIIDNQVLLLGNLDSVVKKFSTKQLDSVRNMGSGDLSYIKDSAFSSLRIIYRGNLMFYRLNVYGFENDRESYSGHFILQFFDEYGFILHSEEIPYDEFTGMEGDNHQIQYLSKQGKIEMNSDIYKTIKSYSLAGSVKKNTYNPYSW